MTIKKPSKPFMFTPQHEEIIQAVYTYHMLTAFQITSLIRPGKPGNLTTIQTRLAELTREKYLFAHHLATAEGQRPYVYTLALHGKHYMEERGHTVEIYYTPGEIEHATYKKTHTLELNNFLMLAQTLHAFEERLTFSDMQHELLFEKHPLEYLEADTGKLRIIKPDALFKLHLSRPGKSARHYNAWVELDRGNVSDKRIMDKLADTYDYIKRGYFDQHYGATSVYVFIVTTAGVERTEHLKKLFRRAFPDTSIGSGKNQMFKFGSLPQLMQPQPSPLTVFTQPYWTTAYGDPEKRQTIIDLAD